MKGNRIFPLLISTLVIISMSLSFVPAVSAGQASDEMKQGGGEELGYDPETGQLIFVGAPAGDEIVSAVGEIGPMGFVNAYGVAFGLGDPANEVMLQGAADFGDGDTVTRYQQVYQGVPVFGGNLVVNTGESGGLVAMAGKISSNLDVNVIPAITPEQAITAAEAVTLKTHAETYKLKAEDLSFSEPVLWIYDEKLFTEATFGPQLVWMVEVTATQGAPVHEVVLVNAHAGKVAVHYNKIDTQWVAPTNASRPEGMQSGDVSALAGGTPLWSVYNAGNSWLSDSQLDTLVAGAADCSEASPTCSDWQEIDAKTHVLNTYDFYWNVNGRDSIDDNGMRMKSVVRYGGEFQYDINDDNWFYNAYWDGAKMVYGDWIAVDDVTAHELTHGVTENISGLIYMYQPGAINESLSDVWGELVDLSYANDYYPAVANNWLAGEDIIGPQYAFRNMKNPPLKRHPDKMLSSYYYKGPWDNGGVHTNSGVNNKAAYLMTDGGTFNGKVITGLGINKVAKIYYGAQYLLFPSANYLDLYYALKSSCASLIGTNGITSLDCDQVKKATEAVQMNIKPAVITPTVVDACPLNYSYGSTVYADDFETGTDGWIFSASSGSPSWDTTVSETNILNETTALWESGGLVSADESAAFSTDKFLPTGQKYYLTFDHMYIFEPVWDGGVLEYSTNGGATWLDAKPLFNAGVNYTGTLAPYPYSSNPLRGRTAFTGTGRNESQTMRYNLTSLAGNNVRLRWRAGYDSSYSDWGWFLDNVDIHTCVSSLPPAIPALASPANAALLFDYTPLLNWSDVAVANFDHYRIQISTDKVFEYLTYDGDTLVSQFEVLSALQPDTTYYWRVAARNSVDGQKGWSAVRSFRTGMEPPVAVSPSGPMQTDRPDFDWDDSPGGVTGYTVQVSKVHDFKSIVMTGTVKTPTSKWTPTVDLPINMASLYWRVKANGANPSDWSVPVPFATVNPPTVPVLVTPAINALVTNYSPTLTWKASAIAPVGSSTMGNYYIQIDDNADFSSPEVNDSAVPPTTPSVSYIPSPDLNPNTKYYWRVRSSNTGGDYSGWSLVRYFRTAMTQPTLETPVDGGALFDLKPTFEWSDVPGAATYTIQLSKYLNFSTIARTATIAPSAYTPPTNLAAGTYYWRVRANGLNGPSLWSAPTRIFTVTSPGADTDGDSLPDYWEQNGYDADGDGVDEVDLPALGANYLHKDIFVEMDYMPVTCGDTGSYIDGLAPNAAVIDAIEAVFANAPVTNPAGGNGINIHVELGNQVACDTDLNPVDSEFYALKAANFDPNRATVYHYMIWAVGYNGGSSSGLSFGIPATDFIVTLGSWGTGGTNEQKIGTFIHELGHNLNLTHGGVDHNNYKPNYLSVMNYFFQSSGVYRDGAWGTTNPLNFDYQRITAPALNELALSETNGLGAAAAGYGTKHFCYPSGSWMTNEDTSNLPMIDWNCDGSFSGTVKIDINGDGKFTTLASKNNWNYIVYTGGGIIGSGRDPQELLSLAENNPIIEWDELTLEMQQEMDSHTLPAP
ncbi:MAG: M4 family metallopeptidase [Chloroflexi bacterium]|nr:M4 family metallopeptidase [Chloroflexota bacterium]